MQQSRGQLVPHATEEVPQAIMTAQIATMRTPSFEVVMISKASNGLFYRINAAGKITAMPAQESAAALIQYLATNPK
jgi:hypothetical protein